MHYLIIYNLQSKAKQSKAKQSKAKQSKVGNFCPAYFPGYRRVSRMGAGTGFLSGSGLGRD
jgi:hypothetical protein